jgi:hypothetical protein
MAARGLTNWIILKNTVTAMAAEAPHPAFGGQNMIQNALKM